MKRGKSRQLLIPNELVLTFPVPNDYGKFHKTRIKIATAGARTDRQKDASDFIICPIAMGQIITMLTKCTFIPFLRHECIVQINAKSCEGPELQTLVRSTPMITNAGNQSINQSRYTV